MPSVVELMAAIVAANKNLVTLIQQQVQVKEREEQEVKDIAVGSCSLGVRFQLTLGFPGSQSYGCAETAGAECTVSHQGKPESARAYIVLTHQQGKKQVQSSLGLKPDCDNCAKVLKICKWPPPSQARVCWPCKASKLKCTVGGVPQSTKRVKLAPPDKARPSKGPLFLESELEEESVSDMSEAVPVWLGGVGWCDSSTDDCASKPTRDPRVVGQQNGVRGHHARWEPHCDGELLVALTSMGQGFGARLGLGLDSWSEAVLRGEWGGIRVTWEEASKDEYE